MSLKYNDIENKVMSEHLFSVESMVRYIKKLKQGAAPGCDGVSSEHIQFAINTSLPQYLSDILTVCQIWCVTKIFLLWYLSTSSEKKNIDPSIPKYYRPIVVSTVFSKIM